MTAGQIREFWEATPFRPFRIYMASGRSAEVPHPEFMHLSPNGRRLVVEAADDAFAILDVAQVTSLETLPGNGTRSRKRRKRG